jgi:hypothetical protein
MGLFYLVRQMDTREPPLLPSLFSALVMESKDSHMLGKHSIPELHPQPQFLLSPVTFMRSAWFCGCVLR